MENPAEQPSENLPATKADIKTILGKLQDFATKDDLKPIQATLDKQTELLEKQGKAIVNLQTDVGEIKKTMATKDHVDELLAAAESIVPKGEMYSQKAETHAYMLQNHGEKLENHEKRIKNLEPKI